MRNFVLAGGLALAAAAVMTTSCYVGQNDDPLALGNNRGDGGTASPGSPLDQNAGTARPGAGGLPCDVEKVFTTYCASCHASSPLAAPVRIASYDDLVTKAASDASRTLAEAAVVRMRSKTMPPPPSVAPTDADIQVVEQWIGAGYPRGTCGATNGDGASTSPPREQPVVCTSGATYESSRKGMTMNPGRACIACHRSRRDDDDRLEKRDILYVGGTVYPTFHEPDLCLGVDGSLYDAHVLVTDASGRVFDLPVGSTGNFGLPIRSVSSFTPPFHAKLVVGAKERVMHKAQTNGDCNSCHTVSGQNGAPGRIALP